MKGQLDSVELGLLKGNRGDQNYDLPASVDLQKYNAVVIYCERFHATLGVAKGSLLFESTTLAKIEEEKIVMNKDTSTPVRKNWKTFSDPASSRFVLPLASGQTDRIG